MDICHLHDDLWTKELAAQFLVLYATFKLLHLVTEIRMVSLGDWSSANQGNWNLYISELSKQALCFKDYVNFNYSHSSMREGKTHS